MATESWERAKTCIGCGQIKEARDFGVNRSKKDCLSKYCRGCVSAHQAAKRDREPTDEPQKCWQCGLVKPATEFHANKKSPTGRRRECSQCVNEVTRELNARRRESKDGAFVRSKKRCTACGEEKAAEHYHRRKGPADGLSYMCKPCTTAYFARWKEQRRAAAKALAEVEVKNNPDVLEEKKA
ncbi:hypothetical protein KFL_006630070 [Klebsormidium nitens]|uniref:Uncharacterized protein n=1 Tax=Klebsormidium nitens TaxID=105231 RepID=A0A1Y1IIA6_KLENI|nr:hypothetical protein KFL_006630070 [Klebsormidium nitens]|eukprot:GAQ90620.1 hypothetical protein KFL_006630070 [Klebsormidium nitens]